MASEGQLRRPRPLLSRLRPAPYPSGPPTDVAGLRAEVAELRDRLGKLANRIEGLMGE